MFKIGLIKFFKPSRMEQCVIIQEHNVITPRGIGAGIAIPDKTKIFWVS